MSRSRRSQRLDDGVGARLTPALTADAALSPGWVCGDHRYAGGLCAVGLRFAGEHRDGGVRPTLLRVREEVCVALECRAAADAVRARQREAGITSLCSSRAIPTESIARGPDRGFGPAVSDVPTRLVARSAPTCMSLPPPCKLWATTANRQAPSVLVLQCLKRKYQTEKSCTKIELKEYIYVLDTRPGGSSSPPLRSSHRLQPQ